MACLLYTSHGQGGNKTEAAAFAALAAPTGWQVLGIDLPEHGDRTGETDFTPWQVVPELDGYKRQAYANVQVQTSQVAKTDAAAPAGGDVYKRQCPGCAPRRAAHPKLCPARPAFGL